MSILPLLVCPRCRQRLSQGSSTLTCKNAHSYAVVEGIPILLLAEVKQTHIEGERALAVAEKPESANLPQFNVVPSVIDPFVQNAIGATNGSLYQHLVGKLTEYPIPRLRLPPGNGRLFLEIGCNWGRWCIAAARLGYVPVGIDPSLKAIRAARRVASQLGIRAHYLVADGRYLPFPNETFSHAFSYSVLQHIPKADVTQTLGELRRVLRPGAASTVQMPNALGIRCAYHQFRRCFREARDFEVRYWTPHELVSAFEHAIGPTRMLVDGFFSLNPQFSDRRFMPRKYQALVWLSEALRRASQTVPAMAYVADSLYLDSVRSAI